MAAWWPTALVVGVILYATLNSDPVGADRFPAIPHLDKLIHAIMFGGLFSAISFDRRRDDILDWLADTAGIIIAYFTAPPVINHIFRNKNIR